MPQAQLTDKLAAVTVTMQTISGSSSPTENSGNASNSGSDPGPGNRQSGEHSSCAADSVDRLW